MQKENYFSGETELPVTSLSPTSSGVWGLTPGALRAGLGSCTHILILRADGEGEGKGPMLVWCVSGPGLCLYPRPVEA